MTTSNHILMKRYFLTTFILIVLFFTLGIFTGYHLKPAIFKVSNVIHKTPTVVSQPADFSSFWQVWHLVELKFADRQKINPQKMVYGAIKGMLSSLGDPYTTFFTPEEDKEFSQDLSGHFEGIGAELTIKNGYLTVVAPLDNSPAKKAGLRAGDKIIKVDDQSVENMSLDRAVRLIRGPKGTTVVLTVFRDGVIKPKKISIVRDKIKIPTTKFETKVYHNQKVAYIKIYSFNQQLDSDFTTIARKIKSGRYQGIILDLRNNPGGFLEEAVKVSSYFLESHSLVVTESYGSGKKVEHRSYQIISNLRNYPLVVLVNHGSASASEILAGALRDNRGIKLIGEKTFGKGCIQEMIPLGKGSVKVTIANWLTPKGYCINKEGLKPDIEVKLDPKEKSDNQLESALRAIINNHSAPQTAKPK